MRQFCVTMVLLLASGAALAHPGHGAPAVHAHPPGTDDPVAALAWLALGAVAVVLAAWAITKWTDRRP